MSILFTPLYKTLSEHNDGSASILGVNINNYSSMNLYLKSIDIKTNVPPPLTGSFEMTPFTKRIKSDYLATIKPNSSHYEAIYRDYPYTCSPPTFSVDQKVAVTVNMKRDVGRNMAEVGFGPIDFQAQITIQLYGER